MDGFQWKTPLGWMIWGYHYFRKPPYIYSHPKTWWFHISSFSKNEKQIPWISPWDHLRRREPTLMLQVFRWENPPGLDVGKTRKSWDICIICLPYQPVTGFLKHQQYFTELNTSSFLVHDHGKLQERKLLREYSLIVDDFPCINMYVHSIQ